MSKAAISATYVDYRRIKGRKVHQIIFEVPSEMWPEAYRALGEPSIDSSEWFAIAKMNGVEPAKAKGGKLAQRAGILCGETGFRIFLANRLGRDVGMSPDEAKQEIYRLCGVTSRAHLDHDDRAARSFHDLVVEYDVWRMAA